MLKIKDGRQIDGKKKCKGDEPCPFLRPKGYPPFLPETDEKKENHPRADKWEIMFYDPIVDLHRGKDHKSPPQDNEQPDPCYFCDNSDQFRKYVSAFSIHGQDSEQCSK